MSKPATIHQIKTLGEGIGRLPFVGYHDNEHPRRLGRDFWAVSPTGRWELDRFIGRKLADEFLLYYQQDRFQSLLGLIVKDMIAKGRFTGIECGFFTRLSIDLERPSRRMG